MAIRRIRVQDRDLVVKSASGRSRANLRREAELLTTLAGPGVPEVVALRDHDDRTDLVMASLGEHDLAELGAGRTGGVHPDEVVAHLADLAEVLDALHRKGWVHGAVCAEHVVVGTNGTSLCSWGSARPAAGDDDTDIDDLLTLVHATLGRVTVGPIAARLAWRRRRAKLLAALPRSDNGPSAGDVAAALSPDGVTSGPTSESTARRAVRATKKRTRTARRERSTVGTIWPNRRILGATLATTTLTALAVLSVGPFGADRPSEGAHASPADTLSLSGKGCRPVQDTLGVDLDGDGCAEPILVDGHHIRAGDISFSVGEPGDVVVVDRWDCVGQPRVRLLRVSTGEIHEFDDWAGDGDPLRGRRIGRAPGAVDLAVSTEDGCARSLAVDHNDEKVAVEP